MSASSQNYNTAFNLLSWNINGIKRKFSSEYVQNLFCKFDIVVISESHLNILDKCPKGSKDLFSLGPFLTVFGHHFHYSL